MTVTGITSADVLYQAARAVEVDIRECQSLNRRGSRYRFTLKLGPSKAYRRLSRSGRKVSAVCWHGHAVFFRQLFALAPTAEIRSNWAGGRTHYTAENFEHTFGATGGANIGNQMAPIAYRDACDYDSHPINRERV